MASNDRDASRPERRSSRRSRRESESALSEDDYDLTAHAVSDGFRPSAAGSASPTASRHQQAQRSLPQPTRHASPIFPRSPPPAALQPPPKGFGEFNRPSSTSKPPRAHDSLTLRNDGSSAPSTQSNGSQPMREAGAYQGSTQPSHPYQMYPQRTFSNATASTASRVGRRSVEDARGPTHPYTLYTQNTASAEESNPQQQQHSQIPVGFNGMGSAYQRQIGPDGEEAGDLIGPLGHMEELPPYTRYPQDSYQTKSESTESANTPTSPTVATGGAVTIGATASPSSPVEAIPGAGGIGLATRNPEFASTEDLSGLPYRARSVRSVASVESHHDINGAARDYAEKPQMGKWQKRAKKKLCGIIPYWSICLLFICVVLLGIVMGAVIGTIMTRHGGSKAGGGDKQYDNKPPPPPESGGDITELPHVPAGLPPLNIGPYALPPMDKYSVPKSCIKDSLQTPAWSCDMPYRWYSMNVTPIRGAEPTANYALNLASFNYSASKFIWGTQPPEIHDLRPLKLVRDNNELDRGPAWFMEVEYNKTVMVKEDSLKAPSKGSSKRHWDFIDELTVSSSYDMSRFNKKGRIATEGEKPWICTWPRTKLQIFIYANQTFSAGHSTTSAPPANPTSIADDGPSTNSPDYKPAYPKLVKFVERRTYDEDDWAPATCTQYEITNDGCDKEVVIGDDGKPVTITIQEVAKYSRSPLAARSRASEVEFLDNRDVTLTPCGCVSFSWSV